ncbi:hypothetical protein H0I29_11350 [Polaribacter sp. R2A056_3_33]|uniref:hypothetical protein n=1 Tax=Polaribacter sp. R2A056_3_33 TaxID=2745563 RepID=UPI001C4EB178|nr:hypothetical protein [Polaribacter sp. R2A056_3_33]QXP69227.1 hypothetical protein H0I29_11350 [Polaribacter sp. R2A056_3_33]
MKSYKKVVIIFPKDTSIDFLNPIFEFAKNIFKNATVDRPEPNSNCNSIDDETDLIIFLGHGTSRVLFGSTDENNQKTSFISINNGSRLFDECTTILFSCNSIDFLKNIKANPVIINSFVVFGDMPTDEPHVYHNKANNKNYWTEYDESQLIFYKQTLVESFINGLRFGYNSDSIKGFYKGVSFIINKRINYIILNSTWKRNQKLQLIERLIEFKNEIKYSESI